MSEFGVCVRGYRGFKEISSFSETRIISRAFYLLAGRPLAHPREITASQGFLEARGPLPVPPSGIRAAEYQSGHGCWKYL